MTLTKIEEILKYPDYIYKHSNKTSSYHYEKDYGEDTYRVTVGKYKKVLK